MKKQLLSIAIILTQVLFAFSFSVDQSALHVTTAKGSQQTYPMVIRNDNEIPLTINAYVRDWQYTDTGAKKFLSAGSSAWGCASWLKLSEQQFVVPAKGTKQVQVLLQTPQNATGGHQAVVFFETDVPSVPTADGVLQYAARIGVIVYQNTEKDTTYAVTVAEAKASKVGDKVYYRMVLNNTGNAWNNALVNISVLNGDEVVQQLQKGPYAFLPLESVKAVGSFEAVAQATQVVYVVEDYQHNLSTGGVQFTTENIIPAIVPLALASPALAVETIDSVFPEVLVTPTVGGVELVDYAVKFQPQTRDLKVYVKLTSSSAQTAKAFVKVTNAAGIGVKTVELNERTVVPEKPAQMVVLWPIYHDLPAGEYQCELSLIVNGQTLTQNRTVRW